MRKGGIRVAAARSGVAVLVWGAAIAAAGTVAAQDDLTPDLPTGRNFGGGDQTGLEQGERYGLEVHPNFGISEIITDNARGTSGSGTSGDLVSLFTPGVTIQDHAPRFDLNVNYNLSVEKYAANSDLDQINNNLLASLNSELWREHLTLDGTSSISRQLINAQGNLPATGTLNTGLQSNVGTLNVGNQATVQTVQLSPTLHQRFGDDATADLRYTLGQTSSGGVLADTTENAANLSMQSGEGFAAYWQWDAQASLTRFTQEGGNPALTQLQGQTTPTGSSSTDDRSFNFDLKYAATRWLRLVAGAGYDDITNATLNGSAIRDNSENVGFELTGARGTVDLTIFHRYGKTYPSLQANYAITPRTQLIANVDYTITTTQANLLGNTASLGATPQGNFVNTQTGLPFSPTNGLTGINNGLGNSAFRQQTAQFNLVTTLDRETYSAGLIYNDQTTEGASFDNTSTNLILAYTRDLTPDTSASANFDYTNTTQTGTVGVTDDILSISGALTYALSDTVSTSANYTFVFRTSSTPGQTLRSNALTFTLNKSF